MIPTASSSVMHWRMQSFVEATWRLGIASFQNPLWIKDLSHIQPWQDLITDDSYKPQPVPEDKQYNPMFIRQFVPMIESGCQNADAVVFQYVHQEGGVELFDAIKQKFPHLPILVEIDDNILSVPDYNEAHGAFAPGEQTRRRVIAQLRAADGVIVSTPYLKEIFSDFNENIYVIPNAIDFKKWDKLKGKSRPGVRIGWAGGSGHEGDFAPIAEALIRTLKKHNDARLVLVNGPAKHGIPDFLKGVERVEHHATWTPILKYPKMLADLDFDIGIAPVVDSAFNRGKSNLKWLENSALGIPTVAMDVGHFSETIRNGFDGYLCENGDDFGLALDVLICDKKRRKNMGAAANARVRADFNVDKISALYVSVLEEVANKKASGGIPLVPEIVQAPSAEVYS